MSQEHPMARLYGAAAEIIEEARNTLEAAEHYTHELRIPIIVGGTDVRITIEAGPKVAARNAIDQAQVTSSGKPLAYANDVPQTLALAKELLAQFAKDIKDSATTGTGIWPANTVAERNLHEQCLLTVAQLQNVERLF